MDQETTERIAKRMYDLVGLIAAPMEQRLEETEGHEVLDEGLAQAAAFYSWFLITIASLPEPLRVVAMRMGTTIARGTSVVDREFIKALISELKRSK